MSHPPGGTPAPAYHLCATGRKALAQSQSDFRYMTHIGLPYKRDGYRSLGQRMALYQSALHCAMGWCAALRAQIWSDVCHLAVRLKDYTARMKRRHSLMSSVLRIHLLGEFRLVWGTRRSPPSRCPQQSLLAYLLLHRDAPVERSHLAFLLWPDSTEGQAHANLRKLLCHLRRAFPDIGRFLHTDARSIHWHVAAADVSWTLEPGSYRSRAFRCNS